MEWMKFPHLRKQILWKNNEFSQAVALNVAAGLIVSGKEKDFKIAFEKALKHLISGNVFQHLKKIQSN